MNRSSELLKQFKSYFILKNYATNSINQYTAAVGFFIKFYEDQRFKDPINHDHVHQYLLYRYDKGCSWSLINTQYSGIEIFFVNILNREWDCKKMLRPRNQKKLPKLISKEEIQKIIGCATMYKHQVLMTLLYATGIRLSELCNLELKDINGDRLKMHVPLGLASPLLQFLIAGPIAPIISEKPQKCTVALRICHSEKWRRWWTFLTV